jgi:hypothetical protein
MSGPTPPQASTPSLSPPDDANSPHILKNNGDPNQGPRRSSFNFLRRQRSGSDNRPQKRSVSGGKMTKKQKALAQEELLRQQRQAAMVPKQPPRLPSHSPLPQINSFGGEDTRPDSVAIVSNNLSQYGYGHSQPHHNMRPLPHGIPVPPMPGQGSQDYVDPYARTESMTHRGRYSYASSAVSTLNSPRRVRRRKDPTPFK